MLSYREVISAVKKKRKKQSRVLLKVVKAYGEKLCINGKCDIYPVCEHIEKKTCSPSVYVHIALLYAHTRTHLLYRTITHIKHQQMPSWLNLTAQTQMEASGSASRVPRAYAAQVFRSPGKREGSETACCCWRADNTPWKIPSEPRDGAGSWPAIRSCSETWPKTQRDVNTGGETTADVGNSQCVHRSWPC